MHPARSFIKNCPQGAEHTECRLRCRYNLFEKEELRIDSWEVRCLDCGVRETLAYRSDDSQLDAEIVPTRCPFCARDDLPPGKNPCLD